MVCLQDDVEVKVTIRDTIYECVSKKSRVDGHLNPSKSIDTIFKEIGSEFGYNADEIELTLQRRDGTCYVLNEYRDKTLGDAGIQCNSDDKYTIIVSRLKNKNMTLYVPDVSEDDLSLGASASPTTGETPIGSCDRVPLPIFDNEFVYKNYPGSSSTRNNLPVPLPSCDGEFEYKYYPNSSSSSRNNLPSYVGLVNQAMTCYLNSLLQALYMTPEFRNALYNWEFDGVNDTRSIPYQLQKLFLNLQTSAKSAVETTDLTTSFGWQGSDAWHQHDIQELCRVMFDALEQKFKDTKQANLINDLYEGKMLDYVKCLECGTEKSREDTFLDIPLPVRPFGSTVAYNSVEEALRAFVLPETLDGNNQYHCEKCNKKCDAHKGLKFTKFPYLLTLHLKRFDFDYNTMHRIKLNDKVVFPETLNLNSFIPPTRTENEQVEERETVKCDDSSTTDSGSADDESCQGTDISSTVNGQDDNCADSDEGIDVSSGNNHNEIEAKGPYIYELFSIMIHSGSASGGHYYAYIKDFENGLWFCFNDQSVTGITDDDIKKTYGGGPQRGFYSGAYSSSTNAYMLMYRQIDKDRNRLAMGVNQFPPHIEKLLQDMRRKEEEDRLIREKEDDTIKISVYCYKSRGSLLDLRLSVFTDTTLGEAAQRAHQRFKLEGVVAVEDCRLVLFNKTQNCIDKSFESDELRLCDLGLSKSGLTRCYWFLETREPGTPWLVYKENGINIKVYHINLSSEDIDEPVLIRVDVDETIGQLKQALGKMLHLDPSTLTVVMEQYNNELIHLSADNELINFNTKFTDGKVFVTSVNAEESDTNVVSSLKKIIEHFRSLVRLNVVLPDTDLSTLETLSIPSLDLNQNLDKPDLPVDRGTASPSLRVSPQPASGGMCCGDGFGDQSQSNSEDSSLSDSDRTLVGDAPGDCLALLSSSSTSPADQHMASPSDPCQDTYNYDVLGHPAGEEMHWDEEETQPEVQRFTNYFKITSCQQNGDVCMESNYSRSCRVLADQGMTLKRLKKHLELVMKVPAEYFKVYKQLPNSEEEWTCLTEKLYNLNDNQNLIVKLGRVLREGEFNTKIYHLKPDCTEMNNFLFEQIVSEGDTIGKIKKEILIQAKKQHMLDIPYNKCRLREKSWKKPRKVYLDDQKFSQDIFLSCNMEMYLQELAEPETVTSSNQLVIFLRRWSPSTFAVGPVQEIVLETSHMEELKTKISDLSGIPVENVGVAHTKTAFPCDIHVLEIHHDLDWNPNITHLEQSPVKADDGSLFFYKDNSETLKSITPEERTELEQKENVRLGRPNIKSYAPGREKALKIYLDTSPSKLEDCVD